MYLLYIIVILIYSKLSYASIRECAEETCTDPIFIVRAKTNYSSPNRDFMQFAKEEFIYIFSRGINNESDLFEGKAEERQGFIYSNYTDIIHPFSNNSLILVNFTNISLTRNLNMKNYDVLIENFKRRDGQESRRKTYTMESTSDLNKLIDEKQNDYAKQNQKNPKQKKVNEKTKISRGIHGIESMANDESDDDTDNGIFSYIESPVPGEDPALNHSDPTIDNDNKHSTGHLNNDTDSIQNEKINQVRRMKGNAEKVNTEDMKQHEVGGEEEKSINLDENVNRESTAHENIESDANSTHFEADLGSSSTSTLTPVHLANHNSENNNLDKPASLPDLDDKRAEQPKDSLQRESAALGNVDNVIITKNSGLPTEDEIQVAKDIVQNTTTGMLTELETPKVISPLKGALNSHVDHLVTNETTSMNVSHISTFTPAESNHGYIPSTPPITSTPSSYNSQEIPSPLSHDTHLGRHKRDEFSGQNEIVKFENDKVEAITTNVIDEQPLNGLIDPLLGQENISLSKNINNKEKESENDKVEAITSNAIDQQPLNDSIDQPLSQENVSNNTDNKEKESNIGYSQTKNDHINSLNFKSEAENNENQKNNLQNDDNSQTSVKLHINVESNIDKKSNDVVTFNKEERVSNDTASFTNTEYELDHPYNTLEKSHMVVQKYDVCQLRKDANGNMVRDPLCAKYMSESIDLNEKEDLHMYHNHKSSINKSKGSNIFLRFAILWVDGISRIARDAKKMYALGIFKSGDDYISSTDTSTNSYTDLLFHPNTRIVLYFFFGICGSVSLFLGIRKNMNDVNEQTFEALTSSYENYKKVQDLNLLNITNEKKINELQMAVDRLTRDLESHQLKSKHEQGRIRKESVAHLEAQLRESSELIEQLRDVETQYETLKPIVEALQRKYESNRNLYESTKAENLELEQKYEALSTEYQEMKDQINEKEVLLAESNKRILQLTQENEKHENVVESYRTLLETLELNALTEGTNKKPDKNVLNQLLENSNVIKENEAIKIQLMELKNQLGKFEIDKTDLNNKVMVKDLELSSLQNKLTNLEHTNKELEGKMSFISKYFEDKECKLQKTINDLTTEIDNHKRNYKSLEKKYEYLNKQADVYLENLDESKKDYFENQKDLQKKVNELEDGNYKLKMTAHSFERKANNLQLENHSLRQMLNELEKNLEKTTGTGENENFKNVVLHGLKAINSKNFGMPPYPNFTRGGNSFEGGPDFQLRDQFPDFRSTLSESESIRSSSNKSAGPAKKGSKKSSLKKMTMEGMIPFMNGGAPLFMPPPPPLLPPRFLTGGPNFSQNMPTSASMRYDDSASERLITGNLTDGGMAAGKKSKKGSSSKKTTFTPMPPFFPPLLPPLQMPSMPDPINGIGANNLFLGASHPMMPHMDLPSDKENSRKLKKKKGTENKSNDVISQQDTSAINFNISKITAQSSPLVSSQNPSSNPPSVMSTTQKGNV